MKEFAYNGVYTLETCPECGEPGVVLEHGHEVVKIDDKVQEIGGNLHIWHCPNCGEALVIAPDECPNCQSKACCFRQKHLMFAHVRV